MALLLNGSTDYLTLPNGTLAMPFSFACWAKLTSTGVTSSIMSLSHTATADDNFVLNYTTASGAQASVKKAGVAAFAGPTAVVAGAWTHLCAVFGGATSRQLYVNGVSATNATSSVAPTIDTLGLGVAFDGSGTAVAPAAATIALAAIWSVALAQGDVNNLLGGGPGGRGTDPRNIQTASLVSCLLMTVGAPFKDSIAGGGNLWTPAGAPTWAADPFQILHQPILYGGQAV